MRINLRISMIVLIGLSIALSTITSSIIYLETKRTDYYLSAFDHLSRGDRVDYYFQAIYLRQLNTSSIMSLQEGIDQKISERGLKKILVKHPLYPISYAVKQLNFLNQSNSQAFYGISYDKSILEDCVEGSYLPTTINETIVLTSSDLALNIGDRFNITFHNNGKDKDYNHTLQITGLITPDTLRYDSFLRDIFLRGEDYYREITIITDLGKSIELLSFLQNRIRSLTSEIYSFSFYVRFRFYLHTSTLDPTEVKLIFPNLIAFFRETESSFNLNNFEFYSNFSWGIHEAMSDAKEYNELFFLFLLYCFPVFLLIILQVNFFLNLINERRKKSLMIVRMRGISIRFLFSSLLLEAIIISLIASFISIILGILGFLLISTTTGYLSFNLELISEEIVFPQLYIILAIIASICLILISYIWPMIGLIKSTATLHDQPSLSPQKSRSRKFIGSKNLPLFLLTQGFLGIVLLIILVQVINNSNLNIEQELLFHLFLPIIQVLLVLSPLSFLIGFIIAYNRFIPLLLRNISNFFWKRDWGLFATASRNLSVNIKVTTQVTLLIACTISFLIILSSLPVSYYNHNIDQTYYELGADFQINLVNSNSTTIQQLETRLNAIEGLIFTIISRSGFDIRDETGSDQAILFCGIEENFHHVAHWRSYYDDQSLPELVFSIFNSTELYPIVVDSFTAREEGIIFNSADKPVITRILPFSVEGISDFWPGFIEARNSLTQYFISKRNLLENISNLVRSSDTPVGYYTSPSRIWCKVLPGYDPVKVTNQIINVIEFFSGLDYQDARAIIDSRTHLFQFLWVISNFNFIDSLIVVIIVILLFSLIRVSSHTTELGLSRALGMKYQQVFCLMFIEPLLLFLLSGIPGGLVGLLMLTFFASLLAPRLLSAPPFILDFNITGIIFIYFVIFVATVFIGIITSFRATRANISKILKVE
ncbi:MAG: FtsX-like permease family protein [Candidatus Hodarchaeota archaeon]